MTSRRSTSTSKKTSDKKKSCVVSAVEFGNELKGISQYVQSPPREEEDFIVADPTDLPILPPPFSIAIGTPNIEDSCKLDISRETSDPDVIGGIRPPLTQDAADFELSESQRMRDYVEENRPDGEQAKKIAERYAKRLRIIEGEGSGLKVKVDEAGKLLDTYLRFNGFTQPFIRAWNYWAEVRAPIQIANRTLQLNALNDGSYISFENVLFAPPSVLADANDKKFLSDFNTAKALLPVQCRQEDLTYAMSFFVDFVHRAKDGKEIGASKKVYCGNIPAMLGSVGCHLRNRTDQEKFAMGECSEDPMGYFIINGTEYIVLGRDDLRRNCMILIDGGSTSSVVCKMTCSTPQGTSSSVLLSVKAKNAIHVSLLYSLGFTGVERKPRTIPALLIYRILGVESPEKIIAMISRFSKPEHARKIWMALIPSLQEFENNSDELRLIAEYRKSENLSADLNYVAIHRDIRAELFPHMSRLEDGTELQGKELDMAKLNLYSMMICRIAEYQAGLRQMDDRDDWSFRRVNGAASAFESLFGSLWKKFTDGLQAKIDSNPFEITQTGLRNNISETVRRMIGSTGPRSSLFAEEFVRSFATHNWGISRNKQGGKYRVNITEVLRRENTLSAYSQLMKIRTPTSEMNKIPKLRFIHFSQLRYICTVETPDSQVCGLIKNFGITAHTSLEYDDGPVIGMLHKIISLQPTSSAKSPCLVNGKFLGWINGDEAARKIISARRSGALPYDISVLNDVDSSDKTFYVMTDGWRVIAPLLIVNPDSGNLMIDDLQLRGASFEELLSSGCVEYISAVEEQGLLVAPSKAALQQRVLERLEHSDLQKQLDDLEKLPLGNQDRDLIQPLKSRLERETLRRMYTHCELDPASQLGITASTIPLPNHNQAPRNIFQCSMGRQAIGVYSSRHANRFDTTARVLAWPSRPIFEPQVNELIGLDKLPQGQTVRVMIGVYEGWGMEDAFIFNKDSIARGLFKRTKYSSSKIIEMAENGYHDLILNPTLPGALDAYASSTSRPSLRTRVGRSPAIYKNLDENGIIKVGSVVKQYDCLVAMARIVTRKDDLPTEEDMSLYVPIYEGGVVESVLATVNVKNQRIVLIKLAKTMNPELGDKFAPRHAQKGTIGRMVDAKDMPHDKNGIPVDIVVNPHSMPSRMTMGMIIEIIASKLGALRGETIAATAFRDPQLEEIGRMLMQYGYEADGSVEMYSGITGKKMPGRYYVGPCFYQSLRQHVSDKYQAVSSAPLEPVHRQPVRGRASGGGLRIGEMERDAFISHGTTKIVQESLCLRSDATEVVYCANCGTIAIEQRLDGGSTRVKCRSCKESGKFARVTIPYILKTLTHLLAGAGLSLKMGLGTPEAAAIQTAQRGTGVEKKRKSAPIVLENDEIEINDEDEDEKEKLEGFDEDNEEEIEDADFEDEDDGDFGDFE